MHTIRKILTVVAVTTLAATAGGGAALADPSSTPSLTTNVGINCEPPMDQLVAGFNATSPEFPAACFDSTGSGIVTKAQGPGDNSCQLPRPGGSSAAIAALNLGQKDSNTVDGQAVYCIDWAESLRAPNTTTDDDAFVQFAKDAIAWSHPKISGKTSPEPASLTFTQLQDIYNCVDTNWNQVGGSNAPIAVVLPQNGSATRSTWLTALGIITTTSEPCWQNGTIVVGGNTDVIEENTGLSPGNVAQFTTTQSFGTTCSAGCPPQDDIFPYSIGDWIAQGPAAHGVGGHATSIWGHGNLVLANTANGTGTVEKPTSKNSKGQVIINPGFYTTAFGHILYVVTRNSCVGTSKGVCLPTTTPPPGGVAYPPYEAIGLKALFSPSGWLCRNSTAKADIISYGLTGLPAGTASADCGFLTAGD